MTRFLSLQILSSGEFKRTTVAPYVKNLCNVSHISGSCKLVFHKVDTHTATMLFYLSNYEPAKPSRYHKISFVPAGTSSNQKTFKIQGIFHLGSDWRVLSDLDSTLIVPLYLEITQLRPDILLISSTTKTVILLELT